jgi:hypothetical protein
LAGLGVSTTFRAVYVCSPGFLCSAGTFIAPNHTPAPGPSGRASSRYVCTSAVVWGMSQQRSSSGAAPCSTAYRSLQLLLLLWCAASQSCPAAAQRKAGPTLYTYEVIGEYPHDPNAFTQGLQFDTECDKKGQNCRDIFWESTGGAQCTLPSCQPPYCNNSASLGSRLGGGQARQLACSTDACQQEVTRQWGAAAAAAAAQSLASPLLPASSSSM